MKKLILFIVISVATFASTIESLTYGTQTFHESVYPQEKKLFESLADHQSPKTLFITCSDSRVVPSLITQTPPGSLFMLRNVGNIIPLFQEGNSSSAVIEYAVAALGIDTIIICGHSNCGAMGALMFPHKLDKLPSVKGWLENAKETRKRTLAKVQSEDSALLIKTAIEQNVLVQIEQIKSYPSVKAALQDKKVTIYAWVYDIPTGKVSQHSESDNMFKPIN